jgi:hypothetical protein
MLRGQCILQRVHGARGGHRHEINAPPHRECAEPILSRMIGGAVVDRHKVDGRAQGPEPGRQDITSTGGGRPPVVLSLLLLVDAPSDASPLTSARSSHSSSSFPAAAPSSSCAAAATASSTVAISTTARGGIAMCSSR